jgi:hypothetical protein
MANTCTTPFTIGDITLWNNNTPLDPTLLESYYLLHHCTAATLFQLDNSKTGANNATIHHYSTGSPICPIAVIVRGLSHIYRHTGDKATLFAAYYQPNASKWHLTPSHVKTFLKHMAATMPLHQLNIPISRISSHSLRAGGAVTLHLSLTILETGFQFIFRLPSISTTSQPTQSRSWDNGCQILS